MMYFWNAQGKIELFQNDDRTIRYLFFRKMLDKKGLLSIGDISVLIKNSLTGDMETLYISIKGNHDASKPFIRSDTHDKAFDGVTNTGFTSFNGELLVDLGITIKYENMVSIKIKRKDDMNSFYEFTDFDILLVSGNFRKTHTLPVTSFNDYITIEFDKDMPYIVYTPMKNALPDVLPKPVVHYTFNSIENINNMQEPFKLTFNKEPYISTNPNGLIMTRDNFAISQPVNINTNTGYTFEILFQVATHETNYPMICGLAGVMIQIDPQMRLYMWNWKTRQAFKALMPLSIGKWYHVIITSDGKFFINATKVETEGRPQRMQNIPRTLRIGDPDGERSFVGIINFLKVYDKELDSKEAFEISKKMIAI